MTDPHESWLEPVGEVAKSTKVRDTPFPLTFLLGAGASLSSGGPRTADILLTCRRQWPGKFATDADVYEDFTDELSPDERENLMRPLFDDHDVRPYVGYRCLAAMARSRPIFVANLNWDNCVKRAADHVGVPAHSFDLKNVAEGRDAIKAVLEAQAGIACAHIHGFLDNPNKEYGIRFRFSHSETNALERDQLKLLKELLAHPTIVAGTSLTGPGDIRQILSALLPAKREKAKPLWVFERGSPRPRSDISKAKVDLRLYEALFARHSRSNYISNPDIDFDTMLAKLRGEEVGLTWEEVSKEAGGRLPELSKLVPPNPKEVRPLLDADRALIVGAPRVGASTLAFLVAWWRCLTDLSNGPKRVKGLRRPEQVLAYLSEGVEADIGAIVLDDLFDERDHQRTETAHLSKRLADALNRLGDGQAAIATASPDGTMEALCQHRPVNRSTPRRRGPRKASLANILSRVVVQAGTLWRRDDLRAWARARGGQQAELVCREIRMGLITTPSQAVSRLNGQAPHEFEERWRRRLRSHVNAVYKPGKPAALLLTMLRLQDFSVPRSAASLAKLAKVAEETVSLDPWGLSTPIGVDGERYLRLSHPGIVRVVDDWIEAERDKLADGLRKLGEAGHWAIEALEHWAVFRAIGNRLEVPDDLPTEDLELFGSEFVARAVGPEPGRALDTLWRMRRSAHDHWSVKDVALDLVENWEALKSDERAWDLRDDLLAADEQLGAYALLEALLRMGRPASSELWNSIAGKIEEMAGPRGGSTLARRQVALSFDAVLWRRCPVGKEETSSFIEGLVNAAKKDKLLRAAFTAACAYHFGGARRLESDGFKLPPLSDTDVSLEEAQEMAWLVAWHFVHQSRCRAAASRRTFQSTIEAFLQTDAPRYLDRANRQDPLDADHASDVLRLAEALVGHPETAGWGLHLIMNIQATTGSFDIPEGLIARFNKQLDRDEPCAGVVSAALTYAPREQSRSLLAPILENDDGNQALQAGLGLGVKIDITDAELTRVVEPRFVMGADPWMIRGRWNALPKALPFRQSSPLKLIKHLADRIDDAVRSKRVKRPAAEHALAVLRRGYTWPVETMARESNQDPCRDYTSLLVHLCKFLEDADGE